MKVFRFVLTSFVIWRIGLFFVTFLSNYFIPKFGATFPYYDTALQITKLPNWIWGFGNFDGVHYLRIAQDGYTSAFYQSFFPLYPLLIRFLNIIPKNLFLDIRTYVDPSFFYTGLILSNLFFLGFLYFFYKLLRLDFSDKIAKLSIILVLVFPTSFYFGSIYTESLFLFVTVVSIYSFRTKNYILAGILAALASATKVVGIFIPLIFIIELLMDKKRINFGQVVSIVITPLGLGAYMYYLYRYFGSALAFISSQSGFGAQRSSSLTVFLPQVIYRYIRILTTVDVRSLPFLNAGLEFLFTLIPLILFIVFYKKVRLSYLVFSFIVIIAPTLTGTLSSMPRYVLVAFPLFPLLALLLEKRFKFWVAALLVLQAVLLSMFVRGYWVS